MNNDIKDLMLAKKEEKQLSDITNSLINSIKESMIKEIAKSVYKYLGIEINEFNTDRLEELNATIFMSKDNIRGISGVIVGDDKTHLTCGSLYPIYYYIEEFKKGKRDNKAENTNLSYEDKDDIIYEYEFIPYKKIGNILLDKVDEENFQPNSVPFLGEQSFNHVVCRAIAIDNPEIKRRGLEEKHVYIVYDNKKIELTCVFDKFIENLNQICDDIVIIDDVYEVSDVKWKTAHSKELGIIAYANQFNDNNYYIQAIHFTGKDAFNDSISEIENKYKIRSEIMDDSFSSQAVINNEFDYSNVVPTIEAISYLVQYCDQMNKQLTKLVEEDEEKNKQFKSEYKDYMYKKSYGQEFQVYIKEKSYNNITCNDYESFSSAVKGGNLNQVTGLDIKLCMDFLRGKEEKLEEHENLFTIIFNPYDIKFARKSNYNDPNMNKVEEQINSILKQLPVANSIFCNKQNQ